LDSADSHPLVAENREIRFEHADLKSDGSGYAAGGRRPSHLQRLSTSSLALVKPDLSPLAKRFSQPAGADALAQLHWHAPLPKGCSMQWSGVGNHARYLEVVSVGNQFPLAQLPLALL
jgi:hypothetical protein